MNRIGIHLAIIDKQAFSYNIKHGTELAFSPDIFASSLPSINFDPTSSVPPLSLYSLREGGCEKWTTKDLRMGSDNISYLQNITGGFRLKLYNYYRGENYDYNGCGTFPPAFNVRQDRKRGWRSVPH